MSEQPVDTPVLVTDNGLRSFLAPTFCFDLTDAQGRLVATVSELVLPNDPQVVDFAALEIINQQGPWALGLITEHDVGNREGVLGRWFTVTQLLPTG